MKLRGLQKFLAQSLGYEVIDLDEYRGLSGAAVIGAPSFRENMLSFAVSYGLCFARPPAIAIAHESDSARRFCKTG